MWNYVPLKSTFLSETTLQVYGISFWALLMNRNLWKKIYPLLIFCQWKFIKNIYKNILHWFITTSTQDMKFVLRMSFRLILHTSSEHLSDVIRTLCLTSIITSLKDVPKKSEESDESSTWVTVSTNIVFCIEVEINEYRSKNQDRWIYIIV